MATITTRPRRDGTTAHRVSWREGGTREGRQDSETISIGIDAQRFRAAVELAGQHWPQDWVPGRGFVQTPDRTPGQGGLPALSRVIEPHPGPDAGRRYQR